jgi:hypothetical protein
LADTVFAKVRTESVQRQSIAQRRQWLGADARGAWHVPPADAEYRYALDGVVVDVEARAARITRKAWAWLRKRGQ